MDKKPQEAKEDLAGTFVRWAVNLQYEDLPCEAVEVAKRQIIDTLGCYIGGTKAEGCKEALDYIVQLGGKKECTIPVWGVKAPASLAAFPMGFMVRALDAGDADLRAGHQSEYIFPALLPMAEIKHASGKDFICAWVVGAETANRIGRTIFTVAPPTRSGRSHTYAMFGPPLSVAKIRKCDVNTTWNAMGIAGNRATGDRQCLADGTLMVRGSHGFAARDCIEAVLLAERGITGARNILEGQCGYYKALEPKHDLSNVVTDLGTRWDFMRAAQKPYTSCGGTHASISATADCVRENNVKPEDVERIEVGMGSQNLSTVFRPIDVKWNPRSRVDLQFSGPYCVAVAVYKGSVQAEDLTEKAGKRPEIRALMAKIMADVDSEIEEHDPRLVGTAKVTITTKRGKKYIKRIEYVKGTPENPMSTDEIVSKFKSLCQHSAKPIPAENIDKVSDLILHLEDVSDINEIVDLITP